MNIQKSENKLGTKFETPKNKKKIPFILYLALPLLVAALAVAYLIVFSGKNVRAQSDNNDSSSKIITEISSEQQVLEQQRKKLEDYERNLKAFESELDRKNNDYLQKLKDLQAQNDALKAKEDAFNKKVDDKSVDRQTIEMYENIDPEQAAVLLKNLYDKDSQMTVLILRKIAGKKAGKILEAMIPLDKETSTKLAKESLDYYKAIK